MDSFQVHNIALKTLQQRCDYLQQRLKAVEEENSKLKLERAQDSNDRSKEPSILEKQVIILSQEKSQMAHQIQMLTDENFTLWSKLSKFLPDDFLSGSKFAVSDNRRVKSKTDGFTDYSVESVEDLSLKLINGILKGKKELEKQYSEMIDLQKEPIDLNTDFVSKQNDKRFTVKNLGDYIQKLKDFKQILNMQKKDLTSAINQLKKSPSVLEQKLKNVPNFNNFNFSTNDMNQNESPSNLSTLQCSAKLSNDNESNKYICPLCSRRFEGLFEDFYDHVSEHFEDLNL